MIDSECYVQEINRHWSVYTHWDPVQDEARELERGDMVVRWPELEGLKLEEAEGELQGQQKVVGVAVVPRVSLYGSEHCERQERLWMAGHQTAAVEEEGPV